MPSRPWIAFNSLVAGLGLALLAACAPPTASESIPADGSTPPPGPALAPPSKAPHSRANLVWDDLTVNAVPTAGIRGDGRDRTGQTSGTLNEYQGDFCGVRGFFYDGTNENGNLDFDPDTYYDPVTMLAVCGAARTMAFYLGDATAISPTPTLVLGPHVIGGALWSLAPGESRLQGQGFGLQQSFSCGPLTFDSSYPGSSSVRVTRLPDLNGVRQFRMESQGNHVAACLGTNPKNGKSLDTGIRYYLPFAVTITQVQNPYPVYP